MPKLNTSEAPLPFPILMGDIGGTNARFSILVDAYAQNARVESYCAEQASDAPSFGEMLVYDNIANKPEPRREVQISDPVRLSAWPADQRGWPGRDL